MAIALAPALIPPPVYPLEGEIAAPVEPFSFRTLPPASQTLPEPSMASGPYSAA